MSPSPVQQNGVRGSSGKQSNSGDVHRSNQNSKVEGKKPRQHDPASSSRVKPQHDAGASPSKANQAAIEQLNDCVYQVYRPRNPRVEIVFFHGVRKKYFEQAYVDTWMTADGSQCWPQEWLSRRFRKAAIYFVSYDSSACVDSTHGRLDMFMAATQVLSNLLLADVGQSPRCPVILVGHDLGGLLIKHICLQADRLRNRGNPQTAKMSMFLHQIKGVFYYSTPHGGIQPIPKLDNASDMVAAVKELNKELSRCNDEFRSLRIHKYKWKTKALHAMHGRRPDQLFSWGEGAARQDVDEFIPIDAHSDQICKPKDEVSSSFQLLVNFIEEMVVSFASKHKQDLPFSHDPLYVPFTNTVQKVQKLLKTKKVVVLYGEPGTGKSSLARYVALHYHRQNNHDAAFWDGCFFVQCGEGRLASVQRDLLRQLGVSDKEEKSSDSSLLFSRLQHLDALIVLDDARDHDMVKQLIVPGGNVKYLLTAQPSYVWKDDHDIASCRMEDLSEYYARQITAKKLGFRDGFLPTEIDVALRSLFNHVLNHERTAEASQMLRAFINNTACSAGEQVKQKLLTSVGMADKGNTSGLLDKNPREEKRPSPQSQQTASKDLVNSNGKSVTGSLEYPVALDGLVSKFCEQKKNIPSLLTPENTGKALTPHLPPNKDQKKQPCQNGSRAEGKGHKAQQTEEGKREKPGSSKPTSKKQQESSGQATTKAEGKPAHGQTKQTKLEAGHKSKA